MVCHWGFFFCQQFRKLFYYPKSTLILGHAWHVFLTMGLGKTPNLSFWVQAESLGNLWFIFQTSISVSRKLFICGHKLLSNELAILIRSEKPSAFDSFSSKDKYWRGYLKMSFIFNYSIIKLYLITFDTLIWISLFCVCVRACARACACPISQWRLQPAHAHSGRPIVTLKKNWLSTGSFVLYELLDRFLAKTEGRGVD